MRHMTGLAQNHLAAGLFALVALLVGADLAADAASGADGIHMATETLGTLVALLGAGLFVQRARAERAESRAWRAQAEELLAGVGQTVERQFRGWELSAAESEVAMLLLKGLSFKEVAAVRDTSERTAREQARAVYKKAGLAGRAELSAWFIEDLLPPSS
jgi:DNA-binding CsgD family transcriptional regulator